MLPLRSLKPKTQQHAAPIILLPLLLSAASSASALKLFLFGDSILDTGNGNYRDLKHKANVKPYGISLQPPLPTGRFSDGHVMTDFIAQRLGVPSPPPFLLLGRNLSHAKGVNFAVAGAGTRPDTGFVGDDSLFTELLWFRTFMRRAKLTKHDLWTDSVAALSIGTNDLLKHFSQNLPTAYRRKSTDIWSDPIVNATLGAIKILHQNGIRRFIVLNVGPLGCSPGMRSHAFWARERCLESANDAVQTFNGKLDAALTPFRRQFPLADIVLFDTYTTFFEVSQDKNIPTIQGACCGYPGPVNGKEACGTQPQNLCDDPTQFLFWDKNHMTHATNEAFSHYMWKGDNQFMRPVNLETFAQKLGVGVV